MDILLVEDDDLVRDCLAEVLADAGLTTEVLASAEDALSRLRQNTLPSVVVTDINLGRGMDGLAFGRAARAAWPNLPIVYISGRYDVLRDMAESERFLGKPFSVASLLRAIADIRGRHMSPPA